MRPASPNHWRLLADLLRPRRRALIALGAVLAVSSALPLAGPQLLRAFIDRAAAAAPPRTLLVIAAGYVVLGLVAQAATVGATFAATRIAWTATNALRERATAHALHLDLGFHSGTSPGTLVERIDGDASSITKLFTDVVLKVVGGALTLLGVLVLVTVEDWRVGAVMAVFAAAAISVVFRLRDRAVPATTAERAAYAEVIGLVEEQVGGAEDLRALGAGAFALARHEAASGRHSRALVRAWRAIGALFASTTGTFAFGGILMLAAGWLLHRQGAITIGTVFLLFQYVQILRRPVETITEQLAEVQRAGAGAARIGALLEERSRLDVAGTGVTTLPDGALPLRFDRVSFAYPDDGRGVLHEVELDIRAGSVVGLVGRTGSGKTTLARLALRLVDPTGGAVRLAEVDLRDVEPRTLRRRVAIVTQDVAVFDATLRDNLTLFADDPPGDAELAGVLADLGLGQWLAALPDGLDTVVGHAAGLSAGQAQLIGVARAFLADPGLVVLDEASSRIDPVTAELVEAGLDRLLAGRTTIVIAHRLRAVDRADTVAVMAGGRLVEVGPRARLAADPTSRFHRLLALEHEGVAT